MLKSYSKISKKYNVSDKTIRKWCDSYGISLKQLNIKPEIKPSKNSLNALVNKYSKAIYQFDLNEHFIKEFSSKCEASRQTGIAASNIKDALHGNEKLLEVLFENINMDRRVSIMVVHETFNFGYSGSNPELCTKI